MWRVVEVIEVECEGERGVEDGANLGFKKNESSGCPSCAGEQ